MNALPWSRLRPKRGLGAPAGVEQNQHGQDIVSIRDIQKRLDPAEETRPILYPQQVVEINPNRIHAYRGRQRKLTIDSGQVKAVRLPHF